MVGPVVGNDGLEKPAVVTKNEPPICADLEDANAAGNVPLRACRHKVPVDTLKRGSQWSELWPARLDKTPYWLTSSQVGVYGRAAPGDFTAWPPLAWPLSRPRAIPQTLSL